MIKVLVIDDSVVFRTQISNALAHEPSIKVVGTAASGPIALQKLGLLEVDVVILDMEMPEMNGIDVLKEMRKRKVNTRVIIFSSQTQQGASAALACLREGADDIVAKPSGPGLSLETAVEAIRVALVPKVLQFHGKSKVDESSNQSFKVEDKTADKRQQDATLFPLKKRDVSKLYPSVLVIGSSTGGPTALEKIFQPISGPIGIPVLIVQHMPPVFTQALAKRLESITGIPAAEGVAGELVQPNRIYVAPGDYHMLITTSAQGKNIVLNQDPQRNSVRPAVDALFESTAQVYRENCLGIVLTGMGEDGLVGAREIRTHGGAMVIQDQASCVVFGMPGAIFDAGEYDQIGDLDFISRLLQRVLKERQM